MARPFLYVANLLAKGQKTLLNAALLESPLVHLATEKDMAVMDSINERWGTRRSGCIIASGTTNNPLYGSLRYLLASLKILLLGNPTVAIFLA